MPELHPQAERSPMTFKIPVYKVKLVRDYTASYPTEVFDDPRPAADFFYRLIGSADREHTAALFLDEWKRPLGATIIGIGLADLRTDSSAGSLQSRRPGERSQSHLFA